MQAKPHSDSAETKEKAEEKIWERMFCEEQMQLHGVVLRGG